MHASRDVGVVTVDFDDGVRVRDTVRAPMTIDGRNKLASRVFDDWSLGNRFPSKM